MWMLEREFAVAYFDLRKQMSSVSASDMAAHADQCAADQLRIYSTAGNKGHVAVQGVLTQAPDWWARYVGGGNTTYAEIISAIAAANADENISEIHMTIDSPGGQVAGLQSAIDAMNASEKPIHVTIGALAASAAYMLGSQAAKITASNKGAQVGSIGVATQHYVSEHLVDIASTNAPEKRPDLTTDEGKAIVRKRLDSMHDLYVQQIADARGVTPDIVNDRFGRGGVMLAESALANGMIDGINNASTTQENPPASASCDNMEAVNMDLAGLKAEHPDLYAQAVQAGVTQERKRVSDHMKLGETCGDMAIATKAINDGASVDDCQADYLNANMKQAQKQDRADDNADDTDTKPPADSEEQAVADWESAVFGGAE